ncbi:hypothetical protein [Leptospira noguchii]|uniref:Uncharacterized protein n=1 Tax=Leptospira noguchii TaxID=28182 RepID=A0AAE9KCE5_9LEPT|nr:hypothetical protein [Leptospira noguchii]UOG54961.1 hypothetical protein MAL09_21800 [Leptospira noguchii]UOG58802.1 hypothetical protein MAL03_20425 [Leptospira noguchii]
MKRKGKKVPRESKEQIRRVIVTLLAEIFLRNQKLQVAVDQAEESIIEIFERI